MAYDTEQLQKRHKKMMSNPGEQLPPGHSSGQSD